MIHRLYSSSNIHNRQHSQLLKQQLSNICTFVTYSAVTAVCLQIPFAFSFSPFIYQHHHPTVASSFLSTRSHFSGRPSYSPQQTYSSLFIRGGASGLNSNKQRPFFNMVSTSSETTAMHASSTSDNDPKLTQLRSKMKELGIDVFIVPSDDPHLSEYVPTAYERRKFLTGFGGSAGTAVVTQDEALLWTDSRCVLCIIITELEYLECSSNDDDCTIFISQ